MTVILWSCTDMNLVSPVATRGFGGLSPPSKAPSPYWRLSGNGSDSITTTV